MNKIIFQVGLLAFCVAAVAFGIQGVTLMETVARSFIVFMIVVCGITLMLFLGSLFRPAGGSREHRGEEGTEAREQQDRTHQATV